MKYPLFQFPYRYNSDIYELDINKKYDIESFTSDTHITPIALIRGSINRNNKFYSDATFSSLTKEEIETQIENFKKRYEFNIKLESILKE